MLLPKVIETREEFDRYVEMMEALDRRGDSLSPEEHALLALLEQIVKDYDDKIELPKGDPREIVLHLMEQKGLRQADMLAIFGSRNVTADILNGHREISKAHARKLGDYFRLPTDLFVGEAAGKFAVMAGIDGAALMPDSPGTGKVKSQKGMPLLTKSQRSKNQLAAAKKGARKKVAKAKRG